MKWSVIVICLITGVLAGCSTQQGTRGMHIEKEEKVTIELWLFAEWEWRWTYEPDVVEKLSIYISDNSISFKADRDEGRSYSGVVVDDTTANRIRGLADSLFVKELLPIYDMKREAGPASAHEGDILEVECRDKKISICLENVYYKGVQAAEDCYEIVYSRPFRLFVQLLYDICAKNSGLKSEKLYKALLRNIAELDKREILITQPCSDEFEISGDSK